ncbi:Immunoglobulin superfamily member 3, partial [Nibea albiflora]
ISNSVYDCVCIPGAVSYSHGQISGSVTARPGDNITLYCDCKTSSGVYIVWYRNCSHENQPSLILSYKQMFQGGYTLNLIPRFHFVANDSTDSYDLMIMNVTDSDEGLYYCGTEETKLYDEDKITQRVEYRYGNVTTRIKIRAVSYSRGQISGSVTARPGDNVTLYCDCKTSTGVYIVWFRNCSHENQPSLILRCKQTVQGGYTLNPIPRFHLAINDSSDSYDLKIVNVTDSDEGLYYCGTEEIKVDDKDKITRRVEQRYGNVTTRIKIRAVSYSHGQISGSVTARPGDNVILYCDCKLSTGVYIVWYRNCSHENHPSLILRYKQTVQGGDTLNPIPRFHFAMNNSSDSYDLKIVNVTDSDEGLYYCGTEETKVYDKDKITQRVEYRYGNVTTRIKINGEAEIINGGWNQGEDSVFNTSRVPGYRWTQTETAVDRMGSMPS